MDYLAIIGGNLGVLVFCLLIISIIAIFKINKTFKVFIICFILFFMITNMIKNTQRHLDYIRSNSPSKEVMQQGE